MLGATIPTPRAITTFGSFNDSIIFWSIVSIYVNNFNNEFIKGNILKYFIINIYKYAILVIKFTYNNSWKWKDLKVSL